MSPWDADFERELLGERAVALTGGHLAGDLTELLLPEPYTVTTLVGERESSPVGLVAGNRGGGEGAAMEVLLDSGRGNECCFCKDPTLDALKLFIRDDTDGPFDSVCSLGNCCNLFRCRVSNVRNISSFSSSA